MTTLYLQLFPLAATITIVLMLVGAQIPKIVRAQRTYKASMARIDLEFLQACAADHQRAIAEGRVKV